MPVVFAIFVDHITDALHHACYFHFTVEALTNEERERFDLLSEQKLKVVMERNEIVDQMEEDRMQDMEEDRIQDKKGVEESTDVGLEDASSEISEGLYEYVYIVPAISILTYNNIMYR